MKEPSWLRFVALGALVLAVTLCASIAIYPGLIEMPLLLPVLVAWTLATVGLFMFWALIRGMLWIAERSGRAQAAITFDVLADLVSKIQMLTATVAEVPANGSWENPPTGIACDTCGRPKAMLHCERHDKTLCFPCTGKHDAEDCAYIAADRHVQGLQLRGRAPKMIGKLLGI